MPTAFRNMRHRTSLTNVAGDTTTRRPTSSLCQALGGHSLPLTPLQAFITVTPDTHLLTVAHRHPANTSEQGQQIMDFHLRLRLQAFPIRRSDSTHRPCRLRCLPLHFALASRRLAWDNGLHLADLCSPRLRLCLVILPVSYDTSTTEAHH